MTQDGPVQGHLLLSSCFSKPRSRAVSIKTFVLPAGTLGPEEEVTWSQATVGSRFVRAAADHWPAGGGVTVTAG